MTPEVGAMETTVRRDEIKDRIRDFISASVAVRDLGDDTDLFQSGIVNSLFAVQLMTFIEKTFSIEMEMEDLDIENLKSLDATSAFVRRKKARAGDGERMDGEESAGG